jgi:Tol biopolymer transport system component
MMAWSPDGTKLAYHTSKGDPIFVADPKGANPKQIFVNSNPDWHSHYLVWSQDASWIYFVRGNTATSEMDIWRITPSGGEPERITHHNSDVAYPMPIDSRTLLYVSPAEDGSGPWLWSVDTESKVSRRVSFGLEQYRSLYATADGRRIVATVSNPSASLWQVPILDRVVEEKEVRRYDVPTVRALAPRFGGKSLFYLSSLGAGDGLWRYRDGQVLEIWKGSESALLEPAGVSPDGERITFLRRRPGRNQIYLMNADGTGLTGLTESIDARN